jgi:hypothetical protein
MSIKRSKRPSGSGGARRDEELPSFITVAKPEPEPKWDDAVAGQADDAFLPYAMTTRFTKGALVTHAKFGKGIVVAAEASQVTVLFSDGKKKLGHGLPPR